MNLARTWDYALVGRLMKHPRVFPWLVDDESPQAEDFSPIESDAITYVLVSNPEPVGVFMLVPESAATVHIHTCLTPACWGRKALEATGLVIPWVFENTRHQRLTTMVPSDNLLAMRLARASGMTEYGVNPKSFLRGGVLLDTHLYGISKE